MKREFKISVRELVQYALRSGDLVFEFQGATRPTDAIRAHQKVQKSRPETYQAEVSISHQLETDRFILTISGRMDGLFSQPDRTIIEEIS